MPALEKKPSREWRDKSLTGENYLKKKSDKYYPKLNTNKMKSPIKKWAGCLKSTTLPKKTHVSQTCTWRGQGGGRGWTKREEHWPHCGQLYSNFQKSICNDQGHVSLRKLQIKITTRSYYTTHLWEWPKFKTQLQNLAKMWNNRNFHSLLVGMQNGAHTL